MKTFGKIIICILVIVFAIWVAHLIYNKETNNNNLSNTSANVISNNQNTDNNKEGNDTTNKENTDYIGEEEQQEEIVESEETEKDLNLEETVELTGKEKAIDIVKNKYATEDQTVKFDHMEGENYVIKINAGTAVTWYLVNGTTWEAEEY